MKCYTDRFVECIDKNGKACDGCLGWGGNCNTKTYEECKEKQAEGTKWCGGIYYCQIL